MILLYFIYYSIRVNYLVFLFHFWSVISFFIPLYLQCFIIMVTAYLSFSGLERHVRVHYEQRAICICCVTSFVKRRWIWGYPRFPLACCIHSSNWWTEPTTRFALAGGRNSNRQACLCTKWFSLYWHLLYDVFNIWKILNKSVFLIFIYYKNKIMNLICYVRVFYLKLADPTDFYYCNA